MKIIFIDVAMTPYYNKILNRLNNLPGVELHLVIPALASGHVGEGVQQSEEDVSFKVHRLREYTRFVIYSSLKGLDSLLLKEKPDIVITNVSHLLTFVLNLKVMRVMKIVGAKLILIDIPFRLLRFEEAKRAREIRAFSNLPPLLEIVFRYSGVERFVRFIYACLMKLAYNRPDAHLAYVSDAYELYGSYGVPREQIFITGNSPDTDHLFAIRAAIEKEPLVLPPCEYRIIHVGRLVGWKRVDLLIQSVARLKGRFPDVELLVAGYGPEEENLKQLAVQLSVSESVRFLGGVYDPAQLGRYFMASSVYVLAGMGGLSINDAMCFGLPVICSVCDGTEKMLVREGYSGRYFIEGDEDDLIEKISWMFEHPAECKKMGENASAVIRDEMNIHTVIKGYTDAFAYVANY
jgi:glycosyltransferase involved in cell wall biosynthesis